MAFSLAACPEFKNFYSHLQSKNGLSPPTLGGGFLKRRTLAGNQVLPPDVGGYGLFQALNRSRYLGAVGSALLTLRSLHKVSRNTNPTPMQIALSATLKAGKPISFPPRGWR